MATRTKLAAVVSGLVKNVDLTADELVLDSVRLGGGSGTLLTKTILDSLIANSHASGSDNQSIVAGSGLSGGGSGATVTLDVNVDDSTLEINSDALRVKDAGITNAKVATGIDAAKLADGSVSNTEFQFINSLSSNAQDQLDAKQDLSEKGQPNGYASLDGAGKVPVAQLPNSIMEYQGMWNASTNSPTLADGVGSTGDVYRVSVAGSQDLGSGSISFEVGDYAIYNGAEWEKADTTDAVSSVNGQQGAVVLDTDDVAEGSTNLYHTTSRARTAAVVNSLAGSETDQAPSVAAVNAALQAQDEADEILYDNTSSGLAASNVQDAIDEVESRLDAVEAGSGSSESLAKSMIAGESMAADTSFLVRFAVNGETAGRLYKATNAAASTDGKFYAVGIALKTSAVSAGDSVPVMVLGTHTLGSSDTPFSSGDIGKAVYLTTAGGFSITAPTADETAVYRIGIVEATNKIWIEKNFNGVN